MQRDHVVMDFYTVVVVVALTIEPNPCQKFSRHFHSTNLHVVEVVC